jgi:hypothetical protein
VGEVWVDHVGLAVDPLTVWTIVEAVAVPPTDQQLSTSGQAISSRALAVGDVSADQLAAAAAIPGASKSQSSAAAVANPAQRPAPRWPRARSSGDVGLVLKDDPSAAAPERQAESDAANGDAANPEERQQQPRRSRGPGPCA